MVCGLALTVLAACVGANPASRPGSTDDAAITVVASTTQVCDYITRLATAEGPGDLALTRTGADGRTQELGADRTRASAHLILTCLLAPNASAHEHDMTPQQIKALSQAELLLVNGVDLEHFLDAAVTASGFTGTMVVTSGVRGAADVDDLEAELAQEASLPYTVDRGTRRVEVAPWPFPAQDGRSQPEFRYDPHVWTSPRNAAIQVANIGAALERAAPASAELFSSRTAAYTAELDALDQWAAACLETVPQERRVLFTSHDAFGYMSRDLGISFRGAALSDFNAQQEATAQRIRATADEVRASGAVAIFAENSNNPTSVRRVAELAGVRAVVGEEALYGDSLGDPGSDGETYIGSILHNINNLTLAWGGTVAPIPEDLAQWAPTSTDVR